MPNPHANCYSSGMDLNTTHAANPSDSEETTSYRPPRFEVISLDCEISSYAPDDGGEAPLF
ncbi:MAG: hypothetical protein VX574_02575 [Myxococcota bacterium]|nr:hypothetical protein [Myxococcota bacterium]